MSIFVTCISFLKELCLFFATFGLTYPLEGPAGTLRLTAVFLLCAFFGAACRKKPVRFLSLFALVLLAVPPGLKIRFTLLLPVLLCVMRTVWDNWDFSYDFSKDELKWGSALYIVFSIFGLIEGGNSYLNISLPWFTGFFCLSVFILRLLRTESDEKASASYVLMNAGIAALLGLLVSALLLPQFQSAAVWFLSLIDRFLFEPLRELVVWIIGIVFYLPTKLLVWLFSKLHVNEMQHVEVFEITETGSEANPLIDGSFVPYVRLAAEAIAAVILIAIALFIVYRMRKTRNYASSADIVRTALRSPKHAKGILQTGGVRGVFRKYMKLCERYRIRTAGIASDVITEKSAAVTGSDAPRRLRDLWLPVRYGGRDDTAAEEAQQLYREIKASFREADRKTR
ncbi:MAG: hypothetical protein K6G61_00160 [Solobacterium sp.]|nr:hypothetical protein [Solobacterium sp.]